MNLIKTIIKKDAFWISLVFLLALLLRVGNTLFLTHNLPFFTHPHISTDQFIYNNLATKVVNKTPIDIIFIHHATYYYFLAAIRMIFGGEYTATGIVQSIIFSLNVILIYHIAKIYFGRTCGIVSALILCLYRPFIFYDTVTLKDSLVVFLNLGNLYFLSKGNYSKNKIFFALAGVASGISYLTRESMNIVVCFILIWLLIGPRNFTIKDRFKRFAIFLIFVLIIIFPRIITLNLSNEKRLFAQKEWQETLYYSNNKNALGYSFIITPMGRNEYHQLKMQNKSIPLFLLNEVLRAPMSYIKLYSRKIFALFWDYEIPNNFNIYFIKKYSPVLKLPLLTFGLIAPLGIIGLFLVVKNIWSNLLLYLYFLGFSLSIILFYVLARFRFQIVPILIIFASYTISKGIEIYKTRQWKYILILCGGFIFLILILKSPIKQKIRINDYMMLAYSYEQIGEIQQAMTTYIEATEYQPDNYLLKLDNHLHTGYGNFVSQMKNTALKNYKKLYIILNK